MQTKSPIIETGMDRELQPVETGCSNSMPSLFPIPKDDDPSYCSSTSTAESVSIVESADVASNINGPTSPCLSDCKSKRSIQFPKQSPSEIAQFEADKRAIYK